MAEVAGVRGDMDFGDILIKEAVFDALVNPSNLGR